MRSDALATLLNRRIVASAVATLLAGCAAFLSACRAYKTVTILRALLTRPTHIPATSAITRTLPNARAIAAQLVSVARRVAATTVALIGRGIYARAVTARLIATAGGPATAAIAFVLRHAATAAAKLFSRRTCLGATTKLARVRAGTRTTILAIAAARAATPVEIPF
jgi:hypothetical protein